MKINVGILQIRRNAGKMPIFISKSIMNLIRRASAEFIGTAFLLAVVIGSGIMGENLSGGNIAIALLANTIATGAGLACLILSFEGISGAHFNPAVTLTENFNGNIVWRESILYIFAQIMGAFFGAAIANLMFELPIYFVSTKVRVGSSQFLSEFIATFGLIMVIQTGVKFRPKMVFLMVAGLYYVGILVHSFDIICKSGSNTGAFRFQYFCRNTAEKCPDVFAGTNVGGVCGNICF